MRGTPMPERKPDWLEEALDSVAYDINAIEWPDMDPANFEWPTFDPWEADNGEA